jgi:myo-inositol-1(or 4)-monophosphatase
MSLSTLREDQRVVGDIAREAGEVVRSYLDRERMGARTKGIRDVVTDADFASEALIQERLVKYFPDDGLVAEEGANRTSRSGRRWYVDPLDGTFNFSRGIPFFAVSLSLFEEEQPILGVVHDPMIGETFHACVGGGAWLNEERIAVSGVDKVEAAAVHLTIDFDNPAWHVGLTDLQVIAPRVLKTRNLGSAALGLAYIAAGRLDVMVHRFAHTWDFGAGALLIREAGGWVADVHGEAYNESSSSILAASTRRLHRKVLDLLRAPGGSQVE